MRKKLKKKAQKEHRAATRNERLKQKLSKKSKEPKMGRGDDGIDLDLDGAIIEGKQPPLTPF